jgi:hypothetical protein
MATKVKKLNPREQSKDLVFELNKLTAKCFGKDVPLHETEDRFASADFLFVLENESGVVGYAFNDMLDLAGHRVNYFSSGFLDPAWRGRGLYRKLNLERVKAIPLNFILTRTQHPKVVSGFEHVCRKLDFQVSLDGISSSALEIARAFAPNCDENLVCSAVYGRELMANTPLPEYGTQKVLGSLNPNVGDAIILVGEKF